MKDIKLVGKHKKGCLALQYTRIDAGTWPLPWATVDRHKPVVFKNINGAGRGTTQWLQIVCNDPDCSARILLRMEWLLEGLPSG